MLTSSCERFLSCGLDLIKVPALTLLCQSYTLLLQLVVIMFNLYSWRSWHIKYPLWFTKTKSDPCSDGLATDVPLSSRSIFADRSWSPEAFTISYFCLFLVLIALRRCVTSSQYSHLRSPWCRSFSQPPFHLFNTAPRALYILRKSALPSVFRYLSSRVTRMEAWPIWTKTGARKYPCLRLFQLPFFASLGPSSRSFGFRSGVLCQNPYLRLRETIHMPTRLVGHIHFPPTFAMSQKYAHPSSIHLRSLGCPDLQPCNHLSGYEEFRGRSCWWGKTEASMCFIAS